MSLALQLLMQGCIATQHNPCEWVFKAISHTLIMSLAHIQSNYWTNYCGHTLLLDNVLLDNNTAWEKLWLLEANRYTNMYTADYNSTPLLFV